MIMVHLCSKLLYFLMLKELFLLMQVSSATATFAMMFSSSMSVVEYYLLKRFPVPYGEHLTANQGKERIINTRSN